MKDCDCIECKRTAILAHEHNSHLNWVEGQLKSALEISQWADRSLRTLPAALEKGRRGKAEK